MTLLVGSYRTAANMIKVLKSRKKEFISKHAYVYTYDCYMTTTSMMTSCLKAIVTGYSTDVNIGNDVSWQCDVCYVPNCIECMNIYIYIYIYIYSAV